MTKARKAVAKRRAPRKPVVAPASFDPPHVRYALVLVDASRKLILGVRYDGGLDKGEAFTTTDKAALQFWDAMLRYAKNSGLLPDLEKAHGSHVAAI